MAKGKWFRLDVDYKNDPKFFAYMALSGSNAKKKENELNYIHLMIAWTLTDEGIIDISDPGHRLMLEQTVGLTGKRLSEWLSILAESGLIDKDFYLVSGLVKCRRSVDEARKRSNRKDASERANEVKQEKARARMGEHRDGTP